MTQTEHEDVYNSNVQEVPSYIPRDENLEFSHEDFVNNINLDNIDNETLFGKPPFLSPEEMAILAEAAYKNVSEQEQLKLPEGWKFLTAAYNNSKNNHYFGVAFWNATQHQVVVAHRGTDLSIRNISRSWSIVYNTDFKGICNAEYVPQINSAVTFAEKIRETFKDKPVRVNFTGHSLGGWLAQITTFSVKYLRPQQGRGGMMYFVLDPKCVEQCHAHTVVFEAPGCKQMLDKIKTQLAPARNECKNYEKRLDITVYLTLTNWINTTNTHLGTILVFKEDLFHEHRNGINPFRAHGIRGIVDVFKRYPNRFDLMQQVHEFLYNKPHTKRSCDSKICPLSQFSVHELYFLINMKTIQADKLKLNLKIPDELPGIICDANHYQMTSTEDLNEIIRVTKQGMLFKKDDFLQLIHDNNFKINHNNLQFKDNFGLKSNNEYILQIVTDDINSMVYVIRNILQTSKAIYLRYKILEELIGLVDISAVITMANLVVIESQDSPLISNIIKCIEQNQKQKCILVTLRENMLSQIQDSKEISTKSFELEEVSQQEYLIKTLSQNLSPVSDMDVFYRDINEKVDINCVVEFLRVQFNCAFITCDKEENIKNEFKEVIQQCKIVKRDCNTIDDRQFKNFCKEHEKGQVIWLDVRENPEKVYTCKSIYDYKMYIPRRLKSKEFNIESEEGFVAKAYRTVIIAGEPGMGKTTTFKILLRNFAEHGIIYFNLGSCTLINKNLQEDLDDEKLIQFLCQHTCPSFDNIMEESLLKKGLKISLHNSEERLTLLFDGFDEVSKSSAECPQRNILNILEYLCSHTQARIWVTTRKQYLCKLQNKLHGSETVRFEKILEDEQKQYIKHHFETIAQLTQPNNEINVDSYINMVYNTAREVFDKSLTSFMGLPLQIKILSTVERLRCMNNYDTNEQIFKSVDIGELYDEFVKIKFQIYFTEKEKRVNENLQPALRNNYHAYLEKLACFKLFEEELLDNGEKDILEKQRRTLQKIGVIHHTADHSDEFVHRTILEYFFAKRLSTWITSKSSPGVTGKLLLTIVSLKEEYKVTRMFLNYFLNKTFKGEIGNKRSMEISAIDNMFDSNDSSCLTVAAEENLEHLAKVLLQALGEHAAKILTKKNKNNETPISVANKYSQNIFNEFSNIVTIN